MGDATQCARCQRRTVGEFCGSCVKVHAEVEELAARFIGPVITAQVLATQSVGEVEGAGGRRALVQVAFDYAETFVEMRNERRRRA